MQTFYVKIQISKLINVYHAFSHDFVFIYIYIYVHVQSV